MDKRILVVVVLAVLGGFVGSLLQQELDGSDIAYDKYVSVPMTEISSYTLLHRMEANADDFVVLDVRDRPAYDLGHVKGAISMPISEIPSRYKELPRDKDIVIYCWSHECGLGPNSAALLARHGVTNLKELRIGWCEWSERGYPIDGKRYIIRNECVVPQRSVNNETVEVIEAVEGEEYSCVGGAGTC
ncbi:rhodanese-like domain-containing protein [Candidatus Woesearchaeota archaeon]|nr:rhodanese-like domain-containing protein [Candidatus Woesearchaeota archaeon]